jgi:hypothetical protein
VAIFRRRAHPTPPVLDHLTGLLDAADVLAADFSFNPTGQCSICFRAMETGAFRDVQYDVRDWLDRDAGKTAGVEISEDDYGFTWIAIRRSPSQFHSLIKDLQAANSMFADSGFGAQLLCAVASFRDRGGRRVALVYLYNNSLELTLKDAFEGKLPIEEDVRHWYPVWDAPAL